MNPDTEYIRGYNDGYLIGEYASALAEQLATELNGQGDYAQGFADGHLCRKQELIQKWLRDKRESREGEMDKDIER